MEVGHVVDEFFSLICLAKKYHLAKPSAQFGALQCMYPDIVRNLWLD